VTVAEGVDATLAELTPSILASLGVNGAGASFELPPVRRACLLLVDGLGWENLESAPGYADFLSMLMSDARVLAAGFPATTATSLTTIGTGRPPGVHGMLGLPGGGAGHRPAAQLPPLEASASPPLTPPSAAASARSSTSISGTSTPRGIVRGGTVTPGASSSPSSTASWSASPPGCRPTPRCGLPPTTAWSTSRPTAASTTTAARTSGRAWPCWEARRGPATCMPGPAQPVTCWRPGARRWATESRSPRVRRPWRRGGSAGRRPHAAPDRRRGRGGPRVTRRRGHENRAIGVVAHRHARGADPRRAAGAAALREPALNARASLGRRRRSSEGR